jgi:hypothetical protein
MAETLARTEDLRSEISRERTELARAVERLRAELGGVVDPRERLRPRVAVPAAFATAFVLSGGVGATMRYLARRGRER